MAVAVAVAGAAAWARMEEWWGSKWEGKREGEGERDEICTGASTQLEAPLGLASEMHLSQAHARRQNTESSVNTWSAGTKNHVRTARLDG